MQERKKQSVLYDFLMEKKYRWTRHFLLIISIGIISTNHIFITYGEQIRGGNVCGIIFAHIVAYLLLIYLNMYIFIPKLLQQERYVQYAAVLLAAIFTFVIANIGLEYYIHFKYQIPFGPYSFFSDGRNKAVDFFSDFSVLTLSVTSITVIVFYKHWIQMTEMEEQIETRRLTVELENLRNKIGSEFLLTPIRDKQGLFLS